MSKVEELNKDFHGNINKIENVLSALSSDTQEDLSAFLAEDIFQKISSVILPYILWLAKERSYDTEELEELKEEYLEIVHLFSENLCDFFISSKVSSKKAYTAMLQKICKELEFALKENSDLELESFLDDYLDKFE